LTWIENRHATLGESNLVKDIETGFICVGQNWNGENVTEIQKEVHDYYGFKLNNNLYWYWMAEDIEYDDETYKGYLESYPKFFKEFKIKKIK
jgi:hypothetical protein